jgi:serine/threonine protein kinase
MGNCNFYFFADANTHNTINQCGTNGWIACECIDWDDLYSNELRDPSDAPIQLRWKEESDIQVAGMLGFFILTKGKHPFGPSIHRLEKMYLDNPICLTELSDPVVKDLLSQMLAKDPNKRPCVVQALKHPYFLSLEEQIQFLQAVGNDPEIIGDNCAVSKELDDHCQSQLRYPLLPNNWKSVIDASDLNTLCRGGRPSEKYVNSQYTHCLRLIRNVLQHPDSKLDQLKKKGQATSLQEYFLKLFPKLPLVIYQFIRRNRELTKRPAMKEFFLVMTRAAESDASMDRS